MMIDDLSDFMKKCERTYSLRISCYPPCAPLHTTTATATATAGGSIAIPWSPQSGLLLAPCRRALQ